MKRIGIIGYQGVACAFAAAALQALQETGVDIQHMSLSEIEEAALAVAPNEFPIYTEPPAAFDRPRFNGYMKARHRRR